MSSELPSCALFHNVTGGIDVYNEDIQRAYTVDDEAGLRDLIEQSAKGDWVFYVNDNAWRDVGQVNRLGLTLR